MPKTHVTTIPALLASLAEGKRVSELPLPQLARELGHTRQQITHAYVGDLRAHSVLPRVNG